MSDNVAITAGSGTSIATDEIQVSGTGTIGHVQFVKLVDGTLNGTGAIGGDAANGLDVDVTRLPALAAGTNNIGDVDVLTLPALVAGTANIGDVDVLTVPAPLSTTGTGTEATALRVTIATDSTGVLSVDDNGASLTVDGTVAGDVAHDTADSGNPVKIGAKAVAHGTNPTAVAAGDRTDLYANRAGIPFAIGGHPNVVTLRHTLITTAVTDAAIITVGAGVKIVVTRITVTSDSASTVFPSIIIGFGTATVPTTTGCLVYHGGVPAGGGFTIGDGSGILGIGADNEDLRVTTVGTVGGNGMAVCVSYYTIES